MKTVLVRAFVFSLVITGFAASTAATRATSHSTASTIALKGGPNGLPTPACGPNDPSRCGMD